MSPRIVRALLASTNLDRHGHRFTRQDLEDLVAQASDPEFLYANHDPSNPPVGRVLSRRVVPMEGNAFAIEGEIEVFDDDWNVDGLGMSVSVGSTRVRCPLEGPQDPDVIFQVEERTFGPVTGYDDLIASVYPELIVHAREIRRKGFEQVAIFVLKFTVESVAGAFVGQAASAALKRLRSSLISREESIDAPVAYHLEFPLTTQSGSYEVLIELPPGSLSSIQTSTVDLDDAKAYIRKTVGDSDVRRVVLRFEPIPPHWVMKYFIDSDGEVVTL